MIIVSIAYRRSDLVALQRAAWLRCIPDAEFLVAAHEDHLLNFEPDLALQYADDPEYTLWPHNYLHGVEQILATFDEDIVICESDIFPIKPFKLNEMFEHGAIRLWAGKPYPGLLFMPKKRLLFTEMKGLDWVRLTNEDNPLPFALPDKHGFELIGDIFLHWNHGENSYRFNPKADPRKHLVTKFAKFLMVDVPEIGAQPHDTVGKRGERPHRVTADELAKKEVCTSCEHLKKNMCVAIRKARGCSACCNPWQVRANTCPENKWGHEEQSQDIPVGILTKDRPVYLDTTLKSIQATIPESIPLVIYDDASDDPKARTYLYTSDGIELEYEWPTDQKWLDAGLGVLENYTTITGIDGQVPVVGVDPNSVGVVTASCWAICDMFEVHVDAPAVILIQDDVVFAEGWYDRLVNERCNGVTAGMHLDYHEGDSFYTAQCYLITRELFITKRSWFETRHKTDSNFDLQLCQMTKAAGFDVKLLHPYICQHIGVESKVRPGREFQAENLIRMGTESPKEFALK